MKKDSIFAREVEGLRTILTLELSVGFILNAFLSGRRAVGQFCAIP
jgi:hypothetical protein